MSNKTAVARMYAGRIISQIDSDEHRSDAFSHTYGVSQCCALLAAKRGLDTELACVCGCLHDVYFYKTGIHKLHFVNGAEMLRVAFKHELKDVFTYDEQMIIRSSVFHHADKEHVHGVYDEILKDADILSRWLDDTQSDNYVCARLLCLQNILGLPLSSVPNEEPEPIPSRFERERFAAFAGELAQKHVRGERTDTDFIRIIRYFPEDSAFNELKNAWCAAFIYHCAFMAGLVLPIRHKPDSNTRFACVEAWLLWGEENGFCYIDADDFTPERGDIVIYDNIIPPQNKPENCPWYDHIGVVLSADGQRLTVAEANVNNENVSGITERKRGEHIGRYIRIPETCRYDGWKYDYMTGTLREENFVR